MKQHRMRLALAAGLALTACSSQSDKDNPSDAATVNIDAIDSVSDPAVANVIPKRVPTPAPGTSIVIANQGSAALPVPLGDDSAQGAADVVQQYFGLIEQGEYAQAWALWEDNGKASGASADAFAASFARFGAYHAMVGNPGDVDAGAGQRYVTVPVTIHAKRKADGKPLDLAGTVTLHRAEVDGATPEQKHWHIRTVELKPGR